MEIVKSKYGNELRIGTNRTKILINTAGSIGVETPNEDLWNAGWRIGFTSISKYFVWLGIYIFRATKPL